MTQSFVPMPTLSPSAAQPAPINTPFGDHMNLSSALGNLQADEIRYPALKFTFPDQAFPVIECPHGECTLKVKGELTVQRTDQATMEFGQDGIGLKKKLGDNITVAGTQPYAADGKRSASVSTEYGNELVKVFTTVSVSYNSVSNIAELEFEGGLKIGRARSRGSRPIR